MMTMTLNDLLGQIKAEIDKLEKLKREIRDERIRLEQARDAAVELERRL